MKPAYVRKPPGSPPPMRGKDRIGLGRISFLRITPAYAGKSCINAGKECVHLGSPPPMRGKVFDVILPEYN